MKRKLIILIWLLALTGCAVSSEVTRFHTMTAALKGADFSVVPTQSQFGTPQFAHYATRVAGHLIQHGFVAAPAGKVARLRVEISYRVGEKKTVTSQEPIYGYAPDPFYDFGYYPYYPYYGGGYVPWTWTVTGYRKVERTVYPRIFELKIYDRWAPRERAQVFDGKAVNDGPEANFAAVGDCLIDALFYDFPGTSGNSRSIAVSPAQCKPE